MMIMMTVMIVMIVMMIRPPNLFHATGSPRHVVSEPGDVGTGADYFRPKLPGKSTFGHQPLRRPPTRAKDAKLRVIAYCSVAN